MKIASIILSLNFYLISNLYAEDCTNLLDGGMTKEKWSKKFRDEPTQEIVDAYNRLSYLDESQLSALINAATKVLPDAGKRKIKELKYCEIGSRVEIKYVPHFRNDNYGKYFYINCQFKKWYVFEDEDDIECSKFEMKEVYALDRSIDVDDDIDIDLAIKLVRYVFGVIDTDINLIKSAFINPKAKDYILDPEELKDSIYGVFIYNRSGNYAIGVAWPNGFSGLTIELQEIRCGLKKCGFKITRVTEWIS